MTVQLYAVASASASATVVASITKDVTVYQKVQQVSTVA